ncbi:glycoside hydrolase 15-related [Desulfofarcimen acetoxidans DSM 771]|uniref:Glycoside hydrolase 15-related n=1 Tax=Desulfofarcimen acetoxidans (strain ATCC 49208 / DSM 771 / KCTC 5769 / VKM B-1644 / 5575) TaxID=485916 RepID=C8VW26_DESAS|nr:glycoside hydrolase family 15 protein [Desulfofarcimen acetoxidans]ACV64313.1 glycoside hydrolase 15-related [Desulfofarcimen acetoxidans DSM 771]
MTRPLVLGNGKMLIAYDQEFSLRDFFYPHVGQHNHIMGRSNRLGFWVEGMFSWLDAPSWHKLANYRKNTLVMESTAKNEEMGLSIVNTNAVHYRENIYLKRLIVQNLTDRGREVRVFVTHDFSINENEVGDTALYDARLKTVIHYKKNCYILINGFFGPSSFNMYTIGVKRAFGAEGTWRDAEDGVLSSNPIAMGSVDSTIGFKIYLGAKEEASIYYWIAVGPSYNEVKRLNEFVLQQTPKALIKRVESYWNHWLSNVPQDFLDLPEYLSDLYNRSLLVIRTHLDKDGAILAAADSDIVLTNKDHYCYLWPRDGALVACALIKAGYPHITRKFFQFCANVITEEGYLHHKYNPDGTVGSSWHPWNNPERLPIQEDETALVIYALWQYYEFTGDLEFISDIYRKLIIPAADFMNNYMDNQLELPKPSYDLWEERHGIFTFTAAAVYAGLVAASKFSNIFYAAEPAEKYLACANKIKKSIKTHLFDPVLKRFIRGLIWDQEGGYYRRDTTMESSVMGLSFLGVLPPDDPYMQTTMVALEEGLCNKTWVGGMARYTYDRYHRKTTDEGIPGNPWYICTLWLAQWHIAKANTLKDMKPALPILHWAAAFAMETGIMPEQLNPETGEPLSVAPLVWSHSTFVQTVLEYISKYKSMEIEDICKINTNNTIPEPHAT